MPNPGTLEGASQTTITHYNTLLQATNNKVYADGKGSIYSNTPAGRLALRIWARGTNTTYAYNNAGDLSGVDYSDSTPDVTHTYDRRGRQKTVASGGITTTLAYNDADELLSESYSGGILNGLAVTNAYDTYLRRTALGLNTQTATLTQFGYDTASRLAGVTNGSSVAAYGYLANSPLVANITFKQSGTTRMTTTKQYDFLNRLTQISSQPGGTGVPPVSFAYNYNNANQRTRTTLADGSYWLYDYDSLGQVSSGKKYWSDGTPVAGQQFEYGFDDIGNRKNTKAGGDENGSNLRLANYTNNSLNQITSRGLPGYVDIMGASFATNSVTVNSQTAYRKGEYFRKELPVNNASTSLWTNIIVAATGQTSVTGNVFVAKSPEAFGYDADGNMTNDGRWLLTWDAENRLTKAESLSSGPLASKRKVVWEFDAKGRRIRQTTSDGSSGSYLVTEDLKFIADGWRHIAELNATNNALVRSYVWGLDLGGSLDAAGGVGGLLMLNSVANGTHFYAYDGNGNVAVLMKGSDGTASANYEYEPFGSVVRATGTMANENRFQFSTKRNERTTDYVLYEHRAYGPTIGRWPSRDPIEEDGGKNLYAFVYNNPIDRWDYLGLAVTRNPNCVDKCKSNEDCCRCMVFCEGEGACEATVYHVMKNRQTSGWGEFRQEKDFCAQAKSTAFDCGPKDKLLIDGKPGGGRDRYDQCCTKTLPRGRSSDNAGKICQNPGQDPTGGAQFFFTGGQSPRWMQYNVSIGNCSKVNVPGCSLDIYKCKEPTKPMPPGWQPPNR
jgi:RHS repeat-associated protein